MYQSLRHHADEVLDFLVDVGPITGNDACIKLGWTRGRFDAAIRFARERLCPELELTIPTPTPPAWMYQVTTEWEPVEAGASFTLGHVDARLAGVLRDVKIIRPHLTRGSREWRRANFLTKHLTHLLSTLKEIDNG
jgi:hypothetical protein